VVIYFGVLYTKKLEIMTAFMFLSGLISGIRMTMGFVYAQEFITEKRKYFMGTSIIVIEMTTLLVSTFYFQNISKNWHYLAGFGLVGEFFSLLMIIFFLPESPKFLIMQKRFTEAKKVFEQISYWNTGHKFEFTEAELGVFTFGRVRKLEVDLGGLSEQ